jgi:hypothetical protein
MSPSNSDRLISSASESDWRSVDLIGLIKRPCHVPALTTTVPESCRHHLDPDLNAPFSFSAVELPAGQSQIAFHESDAAFDTKAFFINRLSLSWRRRFNVYCGWREDQPQRALVTRLPIGPVFDHAIEHELLPGPLSHPHIVPSADLDPSAIFKTPFLFGVDLGQRSRVIKFDL